MKAGFYFVAGIACLPCGLHADHTDFVVINASASKAYTQRKFVNGVPKPETYVFFEGRYFGGLTRDPSIARVTFMDIARVLAPNLAKQNYLPTKDAKAADLLIVVNWGTTVVDETVEKSDLQTQDLLKDSLDAIKGIPDPEEGGQTVDVVSALTFDMMRNQANAMSAQSYAAFNGTLLGYTNALNKEMATQWASPDGLNSEAESHLSDLNEERYFVVLMAYDYQKILSDGRMSQVSATPASMGTLRSQLNSYGGGLGRAQAPAEEVTQPKPIWSVRMNIRANGNNFVEALPAMSKVAADFFGKQMDDLKTEETNVSKFWVEVGPVKVISTGGSPPQK